MLQKASRNRKMETEADEAKGAYGLSVSVRIGEDLKRAAGNLHDALEHMEVAMAAPKRQTAEDNGTEALLRTENRQLKESEARLQRQLEDMRAQHGAVSEQVAALSGRLEALIMHLGQLLEE